IAKRFGYVPSDLARSFYQKKSFRLGLVIPFSMSEGRVRAVPSEYFSKVLYGAVGAAKAARYSVTVITDDGLSARDLEREVLSHAVDGFIFLGGRIGDTRYDELHSRTVPFVLVHHYVPGKPFISVDTDSESGMRELFAYFREKSVRVLGFLNGGESFVNAVDRTRLFSSLAEEFGFTVMRSVDGDFSRTSGRNAASHFLGAPFPDAIVCANDRMAFGLIEAFKRENVAIPADVRVTGFDNQDVSTLLTPALTTIDNPLYDIGALAAKKLIHRIRGEEVASEQLPSRLIVRESA
ncbi:MAG: LacI family DNA-binding transcriptional regulator, partial [Spirochaetota bacterium]